MTNVAEISKSDVGSWESVASFVATFPNGDEDGACDVDVQIGAATQYVVLQLGNEVEAYADHKEAQAEADRLNAEADEECGHEVVGDGAASVSEQTVWFVRTTDDAGGSDDAGDTAYATRDEAVAAAEAYASEHDEGDGASAEDYLRAADEAAAGEPDSDGEWCIYWETALDDAGPRERYATEGQAQAAAKLANIALHAAHPGGNLLCGFSVRSLVDGEWVESEER